MATPAQDDQPSHAHPSVCADCGATLCGPFCSQCGEHVIDRHSLTLWHFLNHNVLHEFSHVDGKIFRTFHYLIFRPGFLSVEYFAGRRQRYINPVRLLLTCVVLLALLGMPSTMTLTIHKIRLNLLPPPPNATDKIEDTITKLDVAGMLRQEMRLVGQRPHTDLTAPSSVEKFNHELKTYGTALSFCNVILLAGFLAMTYRRRRPLFVEHLVFSMHLASFVLLFGIVPGALLQGIIWTLHGPALQVAAGFIAFILISVEIIYLYKALVRFYRLDAGPGQRKWGIHTLTAVLTVFAIFIANSVFITVTYAAGAAIALWRV